MAEEAFKFALGIMITGLLIVPLVFFGIFKSSSLVSSTVTSAQYTESVSRSSEIESNKSTLETSSSIPTSGTPSSTPVVETSGTPANTPVVETPVSTPTTTTSKNTPTDTQKTTSVADTPKSEITPTNIDAEYSKEVKQPTINYFLKIFIGFAGLVGLLGLILKIHLYVDGRESKEELEGFIGGCINHEELKSTLQEDAILYPQYTSIVQTLSEANKFHLSSNVVDVINNCNNLLKLMKSNNKQPTSDTDTLFNLYVNSLVVVIQRCAKSNKEVQAEVYSKIDSLTGSINMAIDSIKKSIDKHEVDDIDATVEALKITIEGTYGSSDLDVK